MDAIASVEPARGRIIRAAGRDIFVVEVGEGPPLLMLHGGGPGATGAANFVRNIPALAERFRLIVPDMPGYGRSTKGLDRKDPFGDLAGAMLGLMDALGVARAHALGNSLGGACALRMALEQPARVDRRRGDLDPLRDRRPFGNGQRGVLQQLLFGDRCARLRLNVGDRHLAGVGVRTSDRRSQGDAWMARQRLLDGSRIDIVSSPNDQLLLAPGQPEIAVRVASAEIPGVEPALAVDVDPDAGVMAGVEIPLENIGPADRDDADLVDVGHPLKAPVAVKHDRFHPLIGDGQADRARAPLAGGRIDRRNAGAFREAVAFEIFTPVFASNARMRADGIGAAPQPANRRLEMSLSPTGVCIRAA